MKNKNILVTGATGGIGGAVAKILLENGHTVYAPVRNMEKALAKFASAPQKDNLIFGVCDVDSATSTSNYITALRTKNVMFDTVLLSAGALMFDNEFENDERTAEEVIEASITANKKANLETKVNVILPLLDSYQADIKHMQLVLIASQAADFAEDNPWRVNEEGYVQSHQAVVALGLRLTKERSFKEVVIDKPALIDTPLAREKFAFEDSGKPRDWSKVLTEEAYAKDLLTKIGLI